MNEYSFFYTEKDIEVMSAFDILPQSSDYLIFTDEFERFCRENENKVYHDWS